jgi:hypothetical protein
MSASFTTEELIEVIMEGQLAEWARDKRITKNGFLESYYRGETPLHDAARHGHLDQAAAVLEKNGEHFTKDDFFKPSNDGLTPLFWAICEGHLDQAAAVLEKNGEHFTKENFLKADNTGWTLFNSASLKGHLDQAAAVLEKNGEHFTRDDFLKPRRNGTSPLHEAAEHGQLDQIFIAKNWVGRVGEMEELWQAVPDNNRSQIDYPAIRQRAMELTVQRVRPVQRLEHGTGSNVTTPDSELDQSKEGKR